MTWAAYLRVSTDEQNLDNQRADITRYLARRGHSATWYEEKESTRKTRPIKNKLLRELIKGQYEGVIVYKLDRWARSLNELIMDLEQLSEARVVFVALNDIGEINLNTAMGKLQIHMIGAFAEFERSLIRERTMAGLARAKAEGKHLGRPRGSTDKRPRSRKGYFGNNNKGAEQ